MISEKKRYSLQKEQHTLSTQSASLSPPNSTLPLLSFQNVSIAMPPLFLQKTEPSSPLWPTLTPQCYFVDYDSTDGKYRPIKVNKAHSDLFLRDIAGLILSYIQVHVKPLPKNSLQTRTQVPKVMKPIIFPVFDSKKYAFVYQTTDLRIAQSGFETSDRFFVLICEQFLPYTLTQIVKTITREQYEDRMKILRQQGQENVNAPALSSRALFLSYVDKYLHSSKKFYFSKARDLVSQRSQQLEWYLKQVHTYSVVIRMNSLHYQPVLLLALMIHYSIREYKIILMGEKQNRHIMSQISIALKTALSPIEYCYPVIFAAFSQAHEDYMDAPVPCTICYWGEEWDCTKIRTKYRRLSEEATMPTVLIDLNTFTAFNSITNEAETRAILDMNRYILEQKEEGRSVVNRANRYIKKQLINCPRDFLKEQQRIFKQSLCYENYQQSVE